MTNINTNKKGFEMTDEEKEAIKMLEYIKDRNSLLGFFSDENYRSKLSEILLNLINKQQTELSILKRDLDIVDHECSRLEKIDIEKDLKIKKQAVTIYCLKNHVHVNICDNCHKKFFTKRPNVKYCKKCRVSQYNKKYYESMTEAQRQRRAEKSKLMMRELRNKKIRIGDDK